MRLFPSRLLLSAVFLLAAVPLCAQPAFYSFRHISVNDGLSQNSVYAVLQDRQGFLWFGTKDGLNRYDGYSFVVYRNKPSDPASLSDNFVTRLYEDRAGRIWVGTQNGGVNIFDRRSERFFRSSDLPEVPLRAKTFNVTGIAEGPDGDVWVGTNGEGLYRFSVTSADSFPSSSTVQTVRYEHRDGDTTSLGNEIVGHLLCDRRGTLWIALPGGVQTVDLVRTGKGNPLFRSRVLGSPLPDTVLTLSEDAAGHVWMGAFGSLLRYDASTDSIRRFPVPFADRAINSICEDISGTLWIGTFGATWQFFPAAEKFSDAPVEIAPRLTGGMGHIYRDRMNGVWFGNNGHGIFRYDPGTLRFQSFTAATEKELGWKGFSVRTIYTDDKGRLWIGSYGGLFVRDAEGKEFRRIPEFDQHVVRSIVQDKTGAFWFATDGLVKYTPEKGIVHWYRHRDGDDGSIRSEAVSSLFRDPSGTIWVIGGGAVGRLDERLGWVKYLVFGDPLWFGANDPPPAGVVHDRDGMLWIAAEKGLFRFDPHAWTIKRFLHDPADPRTLSNSVALSVCEDPADPSFLWVGTSGGGLNHFDRRTGECTAVTQSDGLPNNVVYGILPDANGMLWLSTNKGLARFDPRSRSIRSYRFEDGLQGDEFNSGAYHASADSTFYFGGINGFDRFRPDRVKDSPFIPAVVITDLRVLNRPVSIQDSSGVLQRTITETDRITLTHRQNVFTLTFAALDYGVPEKNRYEYMLEGFDTHFVPAPKGRTATYMNLEPGTYRFRVKGSNHDGVWNEEGASLEIVILPPWWGTVWFRVTVIVLLFAVVAGSIRYLELRRLKERMRKLEQDAALQKERLRISKDMHDDVGARLTQIGLLSELSRRSPDVPEEVRGQMVKISGAVRETVDAFDEIVWAVNPQYDLLEGTAEYIGQVAAEFLGRADIRCVLVMPDAFSAAPVSAEVRHNLFMAVKEALNNIVKHAAARTVELSIQETERDIRITIADDGRGFEPSSVAMFHHGLANFRRRMQEIGGTATVNSVPGNGTVVTFTAPRSSASDLPTTSTT